MHCNETFPTSMIARKELRPRPTEQSKLRFQGQDRRKIQRESERALKGVQREGSNGSCGPAASQCVFGVRERERVRGNSEVPGRTVGLHTEMRFNLCTWLGEISSCSFLTVLPGPAWVLLNKFCK